MISAKKHTLKLITDATKIWPHLNGIMCIYKPSGLTVNQTRLTLMSNICRDLNELNVRPPKQRVTIEPTNENCKYLVKTSTDLSDHVLVVGERYQPVDVSISSGCHLGKFTSGVMVFGINRGNKLAKKIRDNRPIKVFHVTGKFGKSTETHFNDSPMTGSATFDHISPEKMQSFLVSLQASHQKKMFEICGADIQSQAAYELAAQGPLRPAVSNIPLLYGIRCIEYKKPYFTLEIHACNESEDYLGILVNDIGTHLKSLAHCTQIRCIRQSYFTLENALVKRHWNVETILANLKRCKELIKKHPEILDQINPKLENLNSGNVSKIQAQ